MYPTPNDQAYVHLDTYTLIYNLTFEQACVHFDTYPLIYDLWFDQACGQPKWTGMCSF